MASLASRLADVLSRIAGEDQQQNDRLAALESTPVGALNVPRFQARNIDTTTNLNNTGLAYVPLITTIDHAGPPGLFVPVPSNFVRVTQACVLFAAWAISYESLNARVSVATDVAINGQTQATRGHGGYVRRASGHNFATSQGHEIISVAANDLISVVSQRDAAAGTARMISNAPFGGESILSLMVLEFT